MKNIIEMLEEESKKDKLFRSAAIEWLSELEWADYSYEEITEYMQSWHTVILEKAIDKFFEGGLQAFKETLS